MARRGRRPDVRRGTTRPESRAWWDQCVSLLTWLIVDPQDGDRSPESRVSGDASPGPARPGIDRGAARLERCAFVPRRGGSRDDRDTRSDPPARPPGNRGFNGRPPEDLVPSWGGDRDQFFGTQLVRRACTAGIRCAEAPTRSPADERS